MTKEVKHEYSANLRRAFYEGLLAAAKEQGKTLTEYCTQWWIEDRKGALDAMAKFSPKELKGEVTHDHRHAHSFVDVSTVDDFLAQFTAIGEDSDAQTPVSH